MQKPRTRKEERIVSLSDLQAIYYSKKKYLVKVACLGAFLFFLFFGCFEARYQAEASFQESAEKGLSDSMMKNFMGMFSSPSLEAPGATSLMKSSQVLKPLCQRLGLQVQQKTSQNRLVRLFSCYQEALKVERGVPLQDLSRFTFQDVEYEKRKSFSFDLCFTEIDRFLVYDHKNRQISQGRLKEPCQVQDLRFFLTKTPQDLKLNKKYRFTAEDWVSSVSELKEKIQIKKDKDNGSILMITAEDRDPQFAQALINELMVEYQSYLKKEHQLIADAQIAYLEKKQEQILGSMDSLFEEHTCYLKENLKNSGFPSVEEESHYFLAPHNQIQSKLLSIDVELERLSALQNEDKLGCVAEEGLFSQRINQLSQKIQDFKQQRDLIELSLSSSFSFSPQKQKEEIEEIRQLKTSLKEDSSEYVQNYTRLLSLKEKMLQERLFYGKNPPEELEGIDLDSARALFAHYHSKLDQAEASIHHYARLKKEIQNPLFDVSSLGSILKDSFSQKVIEEVTALRLKMRDDKYYSAKEAKRWEEDISLQLKTLEGHLDQLTMMEEIQIDLVKEKLLGLQKVNLDCINQQVSVLYEQMHDEVKERKKALLLEKQVLQAKLEELRASLSNNIPEKWRFEKWLAIKTEMESKVMQTVTEVVESKSLANHLHHVQSKPLDFATLPLSPKPMYLWRFTLLGAFVFAFFTFAFALIRTFFQGFFANDEKLEFLGFPLVGKMSFFCDGKEVQEPLKEDLETLRKVALFSQDSQVIALLSGKGPDYSHALCENLARQGKNPCLVRCDFHTKKNSREMPGLFEFYQKELDRIPIRKAKGHDYISSGGYTPFGAEVIQSASFLKVLEFAKQNYDQVFLLFKGSLSSAETKIALTLCEKAIATVVQEQIEKLTPLVDWGYDKNSCRISFITLT